MKEGNFMVSKIEIEMRKEREREREEKKESGKELTISSP
jgi:hypothetical protein